MSTPVAYLLTWTTHGTWLHGDQRGSVDPAHNVPGDERLPPQPALVQHEKGRLKQDSITLGHDARAVIHRAIAQHAALRRWALHALNVRTNHVHAVVAVAPASPERMVVEFKAYATRALRAARLVGDNEQVWTRHASTRYIWREANIAAAVAYVQDGQDERR